MTEHEMAKACLDRKIIIMQDHDGSGNLLVNLVSLRALPLCLPALPALPGLPCCRICRACCCPSLILVSSNNHPESKRISISAHSIQRELVLFNYVLTKLHYRLNCAYFNKCETGGLDACHAKG